MTTRRIAQTTAQTVAFALLATAPLAACAQAPVDDTGKVIGAYEPAIAASNSDLAVGNEEIPLMSDVDLEVLVGPIALYPDDLLAIVLPASAYPLQIIDAARFLEELDRDSTLKPNPDWDDSVVALLNYPEVIELLNDDIDWTWRLGEAVVSQQGDVVTAIEIFRDRAYAAGNLKSDSYQNVTRDEGIIEIRPVVVPTRCTTTPIHRRTDSIAAISGALRPLSRSAGCPTASMSTTIVITAIRTTVIRIGTGGGTVARP